MGWECNSHIVCMCIIMRWSRSRSASWAERFRISSLLCTYKLCDYYTPIPILSPFLFTPSLYVAILNLQDFSFTCYHFMSSYSSRVRTFSLFPSLGYNDILTLTQIIVIIQQTGGLLAWKGNCNRLETKEWCKSLSGRAGVLSMLF